MQGAIGKSCFEVAAKVEDDLEEHLEIALLLQDIPHTGRQDGQQQVQVIGDLNLSGGHNHP
jgi:hypothetical protein